MKLKHLAVALAIVGFSTGAMANNVSNTILVSGGTAFSVRCTPTTCRLPTPSIHQRDRPVLANLTVSTVGFTLEQNIDHVRHIERRAAHLSPVSFTSSTHVSRVRSDGPLQLVVTGTTGAAAEPSLLLGHAERDSDLGARAVARWSSGIISWRGVTSAASRDLVRSPPAP